MSKHYHILSGLNGGYMPDTNDVYRTKRDALDGLRWHKSQIEQQGWDGPGVKIRGSLKDGGFVWGYKGQSAEWPYSVTLETCTDPDCLSSLDD